MRGELVETAAEPEFVIRGHREDLHANVTRNHRCKSIEDLMAHARAFLRAYNRRSELNPSLELAAGVSGSRPVV